MVQARALHLAAQSLLQSPTNAATPDALLACVAHMGLLQIDTIHVVARSPYLVLFSRLGPYPTAWLDDALRSGALFETWAHEACFAPIEDLRNHRCYNQHARQHWGLVHARKSHDLQRDKLDALLAHIRQMGPVKSSDFERGDAKTSPWWGWKDEKRWLEALFASGELMVARREKFQRVYDLAERVVPQLADGKLLDMPAAAVHQYFIEKSICSLGIAQARWVNDYFRIKPRLKDADLRALLDAGRVLQVAVPGWQAPAYVHSSHAALLKEAAAGQLRATHSALLSPFDPVVWDRERVAYEPVHYLALLERKPGALDFAAPLEGWELPVCFGVLRRRLEAEFGGPGTRRFIKVLRLLEWASLRDLTRAVERALELGMADADAVRLILEHRREEPVGLFCLDGRPHLKLVGVPAPDLSAYACLAAGVAR